LLSVLLVDVGKGDQNPKLAERAGGAISRGKQITKIHGHLSGDFATFPAFSNPGRRKSISTVEALSE
jgi:hypothetical protein